MEEESKERGRTSERDANGKKEGEPVMMPEGNLILYTIYQPPCNSLPCLFLLPIPVAVAKVIWSRSFLCLTCENLPLLCCSRSCYKFPWGYEAAWGAVNGGRTGTRTRRKETMRRERKQTDKTDMRREVTHEKKEGRGRRDGRTRLKKKKSWDGAVRARGWEGGECTTSTTTACGWNEQGS